MGEEKVSNKQVILKHYVSRYPKESDMEIKKTNIKLSVGEGCNGVLLKNLYLSCDPYMRTRMKKLEEGSYIIESFTPGSPITGLGVAKVLESVDSNFQKGDLVWGMTGWEEYSIVTDTQSLLKIHEKDVPLCYYTGILGTPGLTAYAGFYEACSPKKGETVFVSAMLGCYVVGSAGTKEKAGKALYVEDVAEGLESAPSALVGLFSGRNIGKQVVVVSRE